MLQCIYLYYSQSIPDTTLFTLQEFRGVNGAIEQSISLQEGLSRAKRAVEQGEFQDILTREYLGYSIHSPYS